MFGRGKVSCGALSLTFFMFLLALAVNVTPVADLDGISHLSTAGVSVPEEGGMSVAGIPHGPIVIGGDADFAAQAAAEGWPGDGSAENPYIIDSLDIDLGGEDGFCIRISNTRVNFTISNCLLTGATGFGMGGIDLGSVTYGKLLNNTCTGNFIGITIHESDSVIVANNTITNNNGLGIHVPDSDSVILANNTFTYNNDGILIEYVSLPSSYPNIVTNNTFTNNYGSGVMMYAAQSDIVTNNTFTGNGVGVYLSASSSNIIWNVFVDNSLNAFDSGDSNLFDYNYWSDYSGADVNQDGIGDTPYTIPGDAGSQDMHPLMYPEYHIELAWIESPTDRVIGLNEYFIYDLNASVAGGVDQWWINDTANFAVNQLGIITNATIFPLGLYGLEVSVNDTRGNTLSAEITVTVADLAPPTWLEPPIDQAIEYWEHFLYDLDAIDESGLDTWWLSDTINFAIDQNGIITNATTLSLGTYGLQVFVNDTYDNTLSAGITVTVVDLTPPTWTELPSDQTLEYGQSLLYDLDASDYFGLDTWWLDDTANFSISQDGLIMNATVLLPDTHGLRISVNDTNGNILSSEITIVVYPSAPPEWFQVPADQYLECGNDFYYDLDATDMSGIDKWKLNDTGHFLIDDEGVITNAVLVPVGDYALQVWVNDTLGYTQTATFHVFVRDTASPVWVLTPVDQTVEFGDDYLYILHAEDPSGFTEWSVDNALFCIDWAGRLRCTRTLYPGPYGVTVSVSDPYGHTLSARFTVTVVDTTAPEWTVPPMSQVLEYGEMLIYHLTASDLSGIDHWELDDTIRFTLSTSFYFDVSTARITNRSTLEPRTYSLNISVWDTYDNRLSAIFSVTVLEATQTTRAEGIDPTLTFAVGTGVGGAAVIVVVVALARRRE